LSLNPKTIRRIISQEGKDCKALRGDKKEIDPALLLETFKRCSGRVQRVYEILTEEHGMDVSYSTVSRSVHVHNMRERKNKTRSETVEVNPGDEMQHDTSPYVLDFGGTRRKVQCSGIYFRYSKIRYIKFYFSFTRFQMKCFFYEALKHIGYSARKTIIDNTNLAVLRGTGLKAVFVPEMISFAKNLGFTWQAHELGHSDRKGGKERNFRTLNENFFPGRQFSSLEDLNHQVSEWTCKYWTRPQSKTKLIPAELFEIEKPYLSKLEYLIPPYQTHSRITDRYGYVGLHGNFFWVPGERREELLILEYSDKIKIYKNRQVLAEYPFPGPDVKGKKFPVGTPKKPENLKFDSLKEETHLRGLGQEINRYLDWLKTKEGVVRQRHKLVRQLYGLSHQMAPDLFTKTLLRALEYGINNIETLERISVQLMKTEDRPWPELSFNDDYKNRPAYQEGKICEENEIVWPKIEKDTHE